MNDFTQAKIQKITFDDELIEDPSWKFFDLGTFLLTPVMSLLIEVLNL